MSDQAGLIIAPHTEGVATPRFKILNAGAEPASDIYWLDLAVDDASRILPGQTIRLADEEKYLRVRSVGMDRKDSGGLTVAVHRPAFDLAEVVGKDVLVPKLY